MTANKRIFLNIVATYGRSLFALVCGLFTSRWVLMSLGAVDYGLYGLVGGVIGFVAFFNSILSMAVARFYAYEIGKASVLADDEIALRSCQSWFSTAVFLHTVVPLFLIAIGWPVGEYAVRHWLTIPCERLSACLWVLRFSMISCLVGMVNVPFNAMYTAKQYIAELTIYTMSATVLRVVGLYYLVTHPGDWLVVFGFMSMILSVVPNLIILMRALFVFPECHLILSEMVNIGRIRQLGSYAGWVAFGMSAWTCRQNGMPIFINEFLGAAYNSSMTVANAIAGHASSLSSCLTAAFAPAITNACGAGNERLMRNYALMTSKCGSLLILVFAIPISIELDLIVHVWLRNPPPDIVLLARYVLLALIFERMAEGMHLAVSARGRIGRYQLITCLGIFSFIPIVWILLEKGFGVHAVGIALSGSVFIHAMLRVVCAARIVNISVRDWIVCVGVPIFSVYLCTALVGRVPSLLWAQSIPRAFATFVFSIVSLAAFAWIFALDAPVKAYLMNQFKGICKR